MTVLDWGFRADLLKHPGARLWRVYLLVILAAISLPALGQTALDDAARRAEQLQREEQLRQQQQFRNDRKSSRAPAQIEVTPAPSTPAAVPGSALCLPVKTIEFTGMTLLSAERLAPVLQRYQDRCLGVSEIEKLLGDLTSLYIQQGYVAARVYLPEQDLSTGRLLLQAVEGRVEGLFLEDGGRDSIRLGNVLPGAVGKPLNLRDIEQALDQINRLASNSARFELRPGQGAGDSVVAIVNEPQSRRWRPTLSYDDQGSVSTGRYQLGLNVSIDRPFGVNDFLSISHRGSMPREEDLKDSKSDVVSYVVPMGYWTASLNYSQSDYDSTIAVTSGATLHTYGDSTTSALRLDRMMYRNQSTRLTAYGNVMRKSSENFLEGARIGVSSRTLAVADLGGNLSTRVGTGVLGVDLSVSRGMSAFGALRDFPGQPQLQPRAQFRSYKLNTSYFLPFKAGASNLQFTTLFNGQYTPDVLFGSEQILIGNLYTVRGFLGNSLSGDTGFYVRNELGLELAPLSAPLLGRTALRPYLGLDYGYVDNRIAGIPSGGLAGAAAGVSASAQSVRAEIFHSHAVSRPDLMPSEGGITHFRLSLSF